jgi:hypothetical protein
VCSWSRRTEGPGPPVHSAVVRASAAPSLTVAPRPVRTNGGRPGCGCCSVGINRRGCDNRRRDNGCDDGRWGRTRVSGCGCDGWRGRRVVVSDCASVAAGREQKDRWHERQQPSADEWVHLRFCDSGSARANNKVSAFALKTGGSVPLQGSGERSGLSTAPLPPDKNERGRPLAR